jgi:hypothetical protein
MKKSLITTSGLVLLMSAGVALAQWNRASFPPFSEVDANKDGTVTMQEAKANPGVTAAVTQAKPGSSVEQALKSFFSEAHQKDKNKPYDSPMTQEEWEGMTGK